MTRTPAQRALLRILETTVPDRALWERAMRKGLTDAALGDIPEDFDDLLPFVRNHLAAHLDDAERPWLISSVLEDLEAEAELSRLGADPNSSARMAIATRIPDRMPTQPAPAEPESAAMRTAVPIPRAPAVPRTTVGRPAVLVIDGNRFERAALARALVQARCDVTVLDGGDEARAALTADDRVDVVVIDVDSPDAAELLTTLVAARPEVPVLAWTNAPRAAADHVIRVAGVGASAVVPRKALSAEIGEALRGLLGA